MCSLGEATAWDLKPNAADLAGVLIQVLDIARHPRVPHDPRRHSLGMSWGSAFPSGALHPGYVRHGFLGRQPNQSKLPDSKTTSTELAPVVCDAVQPVIAIARSRRSRSVTFEAPDHADWQALILARNQSRVPGVIECLIRDLLTGRPVIPAGSCVDDLVALIDVILVTAVDHD